MAKEKALLNAELEAQRLEKLQLEKQMVKKSPRRRFLFGGYGNKSEESGSLYSSDIETEESSAFYHLKREIEVLKGEVRAGYKFVTGLPSTTSRSSNSAGESGLSAPCSSRTGNTCTPRTGNTWTPRTGNLSHSKDMRMPAKTPETPESPESPSSPESPESPESPLDAPKAPPLDPAKTPPENLTDVVVWGF